MPRMVVPVALSEDQNRQLETADPFGAWPDTATSPTFSQSPEPASQQPGPQGTHRGHGGTSDKQGSGVFAHDLGHATIPSFLQFLWP